MATRARKSKLVVGKEYAIAIIYPRCEGVKAKYLGRLNHEGFRNKGIFSHDNEYIMVSNCPERVNGQEFVAHVTPSEVFNKSDLRYASRLIKVIESLGEKI